MIYDVLVTQGVTFGCVAYRRGIGGGRCSPVIYIGALHPPVNPLGEKAENVFTDPKSFALMLSREDVKAIIELFKATALID
jgi:hypothetical protein